MCGNLRRLTTGPTEIASSLHSSQRQRKNTPRNNKRSVSLRAPIYRGVAIPFTKIEMSKPKCQLKSKCQSAKPPKPRLPFNLPLEVRGIKGVTSVMFITPLAPLILRGGFWRNLVKSECLKPKTTPLWHLGFDICLVFELCHLSFLRNLGSDIVQDLDR